LLFENTFWNSRAKKNTSRKLKKDVQERQVGKMGGKAKPTKHTSKEIAKKVCSVCCLFLHTLWARVRARERARAPSTLSVLLQLTREMGQVFEATVNRGGGKAGSAERKNGNCGFKCYICLCAQPSEKSLLIHWESRHIGVELDMERAKA